MFMLPTGSLEIELLMSGFITIVKSDNVKRHYEAKHVKHPSC